MPARAISCGRTAGTTATALDTASATSSPSTRVGLQVLARDSLPSLGGTEIDIAIAENRSYSTTPLVLSRIMISPYRKTMGGELGRRRGCCLNWVVAVTISPSLSCLDSTDVAIHKTAFSVRSLISARLQC